jgi:hypothetical protein
LTVLISGTVAPARVVSLAIAVQPLMLLARRRI